jgi:tRNA(Ile)-lysidine synthase
MALEHGIDLVLLAHHQQDQAETFLLQALRGGGTSGLAGMPRVVERDGVTWARPWLAQPRDAIVAYLRRHRLGHVDDDSNTDERLARNRLRLQVLPNLNLAFPQAEPSLTTAAEWAREASVCLRDLAQLDLAAISQGESLQIVPWIGLSSERRSNALRHWLRERAPGSVSAALVKRLMSELTTCAHGRWPIPAGVLRSDRGVLTFAKTPAAISHRSAVPETSLRVTAAGAYPLPGWGGVLRATATQQAGVGIAALRRIDLLPRSGAEQFQAGPRRPARALKKQYQAAGVPADRRVGPLIYSEGRLLFVPGLGIDARAFAPPGEPQMALEWCDGLSIGAVVAAVGAPSLDR